MDLSLENLHARFVELFANNPDSADAIIQEVLMHPESQHRLEMAATVLLQRRATDRPFRTDLTQEAWVIVLQRFRAGHVQYTNEGAEKFGGWLWMLWYNACREAIRLVCKRGVEAPTPSQIAVENDALNEMIRVDEYRAMLEYIETVAQEPLRAVLFDWAAGLSGADTVRMRGLPSATVWRLRKEGLRLLRQWIERDRS